MLAMATKARGKKMPTSGPAQDNQERTGIDGYVRPRNREWIKDNLRNRAASNKNANDMPQLMNGHHCEPAQWQ